MIKTIYKYISPKYQKIVLDYKVNPQPRFGHGNPPNPYLYERINQNRASYEDLLKKFTNHKDVFHSIKTQDKETNETQPAYNNGFLPGLDMVALYSLIALLQPKQYVEIGSGNSTKVTKKSIADNKLDTRITSIDPYPRAVIDSLVDAMIRKPLETIPDLSFVDQLNEDDILFIDNSHQSFPNSDVTVCFLELLPRLKKGVVVHIHDIYLPYDYPQFMCNRFYNEQYLLAALLLGSENKYEVMMPNYFVSEDKQLASILSPIWEHPNLTSVEKHGGSFWFRVIQNKV